MDQPTNIPTLIAAGVLILVGICLAVYVIVYVGCKAYYNARVKTIQRAMASLRRRASSQEPK